MSVQHFCDWLHELDQNVRPTHLINQQYGGYNYITPHDLLGPIITPLAFAIPHPHPALQRSNSTSSLRSRTSQGSHADDEHYVNRLLHHPTYADLRHFYRPMQLSRKEHHDAPVHNHKDNFVVNIDVQQFSPNEITVKAVDNTITVEGKHEEKRDEHGYISRQFTRRYIIPEGHDIHRVQSHLSSDGILTLTAPKTGDPDTNNERMIPIVCTGPHKHVKNSEETK